MPSITVRRLDVREESTWDFRGTGPTWQHPDFGHGRAGWDPFPCYPHEMAPAIAAAEHVAKVCPPPWPVTIYLADLEETSRTNAYSYLHDSGHYQGDDWVDDPPAGLIMLAGKRIPPHPAVTAYLVGHEFGHQVEWMINYANGRKTKHSPEACREYMAIRGLDESADHHGSGGAWHDSVHEILACDFRILACGLEPGYWPHPGVPRPEDIPGLGAWWETQLERIDAARARHFAGDAVNDTKK
jgi:hypothetical protein